MSNLENQKNQQEQENQKQQEQPEEAQSPEEPKSEETPVSSTSTEEPKSEETPVGPTPTEEPKSEETPVSPPPQDEPERVIPIEELDDEVEYDREEAAFMSKLYEDTLVKIKPGEIIAGRIVSINDREVAVDIGFKSEGTVPIEEFEDPTTLNIGDTIEVFLENIENQDGQLVLSKKKADFARVWDRIMGIYERGETVKGRCNRRIKGGIVVDVMGIDAFLPGSQIDVHPVRDFDAWIGETCDFRIVKVNETRKNIVLSRKVLIEENLRDVREKILTEIQIGQDIEGVVKNITDFGAFVDLGGVDGLLHITDLSWGRVNHPSEVVSYDEKLKVRILDFDPVRKRISVGLKQLQPHPWEGVEERYPVNSKVTGRVVSITKYGAFVELEEGIEGLIHISEMSWTQHIKHPSQILNIGQEVEVVVLSIDPENRKVSLGLKQTEEDPWEKLEQKYSVGTTHTGVVRDLVPFGAFVELEEGVEGLVHISDLSWTRKVRHPGEIVKKGDEIQVTVLSFDRDERRIALGHKQTIENPWELFESKYPVGSLLPGTVIRTVDKGAIVELEWGLEGFLPVSHFGKDPKTGRGRALKEAERLDVEVIDFDKENKKVVVSVAAVQKRQEDEEYKAYLEQQKSISEAEVPPEAAKEEEPAEALPEEAAEDEVTEAPPSGEPKGEAVAEPAETEQAGAEAIDEAVTEAEEKVAEPPPKADEEEKEAEEPAKEQEETAPAAAAPDEKKEKKGKKEKKEAEPKEEKPAKKAPRKKATTKAKKENAEVETEKKAEKKTKAKKTTTKKKETEKKTQSKEKVEKKKKSED